VIFSLQFFDTVGWATGRASGTFFAGCSDRIFFYIIRRPEAGNYKGNGWKLRKLTEYIFTSSWFIFEADCNLCVCSAASENYWGVKLLTLLTLTGLTSGVLRIWAICFWLPVPLYGVVTVLCHQHHLLFLSRDVRLIIWFSEHLSNLWSYGTLFLDSLESLWLDNARCELKISLWAWSTVWICIGLACAWTVASCVIVLLGLVNYLTDYLRFTVAKRPCSSNC